jgi:hypothetical protein
MSRYAFSRNIQDAAVNPAAFALPAAAGASTNSAEIDFGPDALKPENVELELSVPALTTVIVPDTKTVTYIVETSTTSNFAAIDQTLLSEVQTGAAAAGVGAFLKRVRLPSDCARYVRFKVTFGAGTTTGAAVNATGTVRF